MRIKRAKLNWQAMRVNSNTQKLEWFNIFSMLGPLAYTWSDKNRITWEQCISKVIKQKIVKNRAGLKNQLELWFKSKYWSRCEWEMIICGWPSESYHIQTKIDVWDQLEPNLDIITDYVIDRMNIKF